MSKQRKLAVVASCAMVCLPHLANAATVSGTSGVIFVSAGGGFKPLSGPTELAPGAQVMVRPGGAATIAYSNNCVVKVGPGRVWTVQARPPCEKGSGEV